MKKLLLLSILAVLAIATPLLIKGQEKGLHPLPIESLSQESGGQLSAIDAYSDGVGVLIVENPSNTNSIDNSPLNILVKKYGEKAKSLDSPLKKYVLTNITDPIDIDLANKLNDAFADGDECDDGDANTMNDVYVNGVCVGVPLTTKEILANKATTVGLTIMENSKFYYTSCIWSKDFSQQKTICSNLGMRLPRTLEFKKTNSNSRSHRDGFTLLGRDELGVPMCGTGYNHVDKEVRPNVYVAKANGVISFYNKGDRRHYPTICVKLK